MISILLAAALAGAAAGQPGSSASWTGAGWYAVARIVEGRDAFYEMAPSRFADRAACVKDLQASGLAGGDVSEDGITVRCVLLGSKPYDDALHGGIVQPPGMQFNAGS
jgi:hypothetical protein